MFERKEKAEYMRKEKAYSIRYLLCTKCLENNIELNSEVYDLFQATKKKST
jgi:hypothetical protein